MNDDFGDRICISAVDHDFEAWVPVPFPATEASRRAYEEAVAALVDLVSAIEPCPLVLVEDWYG